MTVYLAVVYAAMTPASAALVVAPVLHVMRLRRWRRAFTAPQPKDLFIS